MPDFPVLHYPKACSNSCPLSWWCHPTILSSVVPFSSCLQSFPASGSFLISWLFASGIQFWSFSFSLTPFNEYSGLISFRIDWLGTLKSLFQHHNSKASIRQLSAFFMVQLSHPYMTTGRTIALTVCTFVSKVISLLFNMLSRLIIAFLPRSRCLIFMAAVTVCSDFGAPKTKLFHCFHCSLIYLPWSDAITCHDLCFLDVEF